MRLFRTRTQTNAEADSAFAHSPQPLPRLLSFDTIGKWVVMGLGLPGLAVLLAACAGLGGGPAGSDPSLPRMPATVSGVVMGETGPIGGAIVTVQGTANQTTTNDDGTYRIHGEGLGGTSAITISAWADGHYVGWTSLDPQKPIWKDDGKQGATEVAVHLKKYFETDNFQYNWFQLEGKHGSATCGICHRENGEWQADAHSKSAINPRFISMYRGTNLQGQKSQPTRFTTDGKILPPDAALPDYGPGFRLDNGERPGNCATCHTPMAAKIETTNTCAWSGCHASTTADKAEAAGSVRQTIRGATPVGIFGVAEEGINCEFCHVVHSVRVDSATGLPFADQPGIMSMELRRPQDGHKLFFGTFPDANREEVTHLPFISESRFCAACHYGVMGGVVSNMKVTGGVEVYTSYREWLESPYSDPQTGKTCQNCHMPVKNVQYSVVPDKGGIARNHDAYHDHTMTGPSTSQALMWNAVTLKPDALVDGNTVRVNVSVTNDKTGHAVPTDAPIRSMMLVVEVLDAAGRPLALQTGPVLPSWAGDYAGWAGRAFAKVLKDTWTGETPTAAYWRPVTIVEDTRLYPMKTDASTYSFQLPQGGAAQVHVKLIYRRAFQKLAQQKGWADPDIIMAEATLNVGK